MRAVRALLIFLVGAIASLLVTYAVIFRPRIKAWGVDPVEQRRPAGRRAHRRPDGDRDARRDDRRARVAGLAVARPDGLRPRRLVQLRLDGQALQERRLDPARVPEARAGRDHADLQRRRLRGSHGRSRECPRALHRHRDDGDSRPRTPALRDRRAARRGERQSAASSAAAHTPTSAPRGRSSSTRPTTVRRASSSASASRPRATCRPTPSCRS